MKIDLKKLFQKILDHRKDPKIFVAVFTILLSCISFGYCSDTEHCFSSFQAQSNLTCAYSWNNFQYLYFLDSNHQYIFNCGSNCGIFNSVCFKTTSGDYYSFECDNPNYDIFVDYYNIGSSQPAQFIVRLSDLGNNSTNDMQFYLNAGDTDMYKVSYASNVNASFGQNSVSFSSNVSCSVCESSLSSCQSDYSSCYSSLNTCQSDYSSCNSSLSSCQDDFESASGYVSSLEGELNQCTQDLINCSNSSNSGSCETGSNWSALYINDIQHLGKPNIFITIPEEIYWSYTSTGDDFDLNVSGYNVDTEYIENVIDIQNTKPTQDDFNRIISQVIPLFIPGLFIILFIYFVFRLVKKVF